MKLRIAALAATAATTAVLAVAAGPAHAVDRDVTVASAGTEVRPLAGDDACIGLYVGGILTGTGCFVSYGDKIWAEDNRSDGLRVVVETKFDYNRPNGECHQAGGAGVGGYCNYNMREDGKVSFRVLTRNGADGPNRSVGAWSPWLRIG